MASYAKNAGILFFVGAAQFVFCLQLAEILYPGYDVSTDYISDLGATCRNTHCVIEQPSSTVFNVSIIILGLLAVIAAYNLAKALNAKLAPALTAIGSLAAIGVGLFTETTGSLHDILSAVVFLAMGLAAIAFARYQKAPMSYFSALAGIVTLLAAALFEAGDYFGLGAGGMERVIVYPTLLWLLGFGGYLMALGDRDAAAVPPS